MAEEIVKPLTGNPPPPPPAKNTSSETPVDVKTEAVKEEKPKIEPDDKDDIDAKLLIPMEPYTTSPLFYEIANYFGIEQGDYDNAKNELSVIVDWAIQKASSNKLEDVLVTIRQLEDNIMMPGWGEKRHSNMYRYLRLQAKADAFNKALSAYKRGEIT